MYGYVPEVRRNISHLTIELDSPGNASSQRFRPGPISERLFPTSFSLVAAGQLPVRGAPCLNKLFDTTCTGGNWVLFNENCM